MVPAPVAASPRRSQTMPRQREGDLAIDESRIEYERRMHRVLEAIDRRIGEPLDLASLAAVAHFSQYHFHRLFAAWMGETLGEYLRRRRVELAAARMAAQPLLPVLQAALAVGFGSRASRSMRATCRRGARKSPRCPAAATLRWPSAAPGSRSGRRGRGCWASGCRRAACNSTAGRASSTTPAGAAYDEASGAFECELCIPVAPL